MGWSIGYDTTWKRDIGYGVPAWCDHPGCQVQIDRGLSHVCCQQQPYGGDEGCGLYFCSSHQSWDGRCERCQPEEDNRELLPPFDAKPDHPAWLRHKLTDPSWTLWRQENPEEVVAMHLSLMQQETA